MAAAALNFKFTDEMGARGPCVWQSFARFDLWEILVVALIDVVFAFCVVEFVRARARRGYISWFSRGSKYVPLAYMFDRHVFQKCHKRQTSGIIT